MSLLSILGEITLFNYIRKLLSHKHDSESTTYSDPNPIIIDEHDDLAAHDDYLRTYKSHDLYESYDSYDYEAAEDFDTMDTYDELEDF